MEGKNWKVKYLFSIIQPALEYFVSIKILLLASTQTFLINNTTFVSGKERKYTWLFVLITESESKFPNFWMFTSIYDLFHSFLLCPCFNLKDISLNDVIGLFWHFKGAGVVEKVEVEVEIKEYKYEELVKALENFENKYYIFLFFFFFYLILWLDWKELDSYSCIKFVNPNKI